MKTWLALAVLLYSVPVHADTHPADDCTVTEIQSAIDAAEAHATSWEKVTIPACAEEVHTSQLTVVVPSGTTFWIQGAGKGVTTLSDEIVKDNTPDTKWIYVTGIDSTNKFRISSFTFNGLADDPSNNNYGYWLIVGSAADETPNIRIDDIEAYAESQPWLMWGGCPYAVIDNYTFYSEQDSANFSTVFHSNCGGGAYGDGSWASPITPGSWNAVYIENGTIARNHVMTTALASLDQFQGSRVVVRNNTISEATIAGHGTAEGGRNRGQMWEEIYGNTFFCDETTIDTNIQLRGGTGVVVNNTTTGCSTSFAWNNFIVMKDRRSFDGPAGAPWGQFCDGMQPFDGNMGPMGQEGYPCIDQQGRGQGNLLSGEDPMPAEWPDQELRPVYITGNDLNAYNQTFGVCAGQGYVNADRDFYCQLGGAQTSSSSPFDGTTGAGWGTFLSPNYRPSTCTIGVAYYATDEDKLYKCTSTNTWTLYWANPGSHPLANESAWTEPTAPSTGSGTRRLRLRVR